MTNAVFKIYFPYMRPSCDDLNIYANVAAGLSLEAERTLSMYTVEIFFDNEIQSVRIKSFDVG